MNPPSTEPERDEPGSKRLLREFGRDRRRVRVGLGCVGLGLVLGLVALRHERTIASWWRGEIDLRGETRFVPEHPPGQVEWQRVHAELLPAWIIAQGSQRGSDAERALNANRAFAELRYGLAPDENLLDMVDELDMHLRADPVAEAQRIDYLLWAYNHYLDGRRIPWRLEATMHVRRDGSPTFLTRSYQVMSDLRNPAGQRLRLLRRADLTNIEEGFLGHTTGRDEGAMVMLDQTLQFAVQVVWPLLHPGLDERLPESLRSLAPYVREEAARGLPAGLLGLLGVTAVDELALIEVADAIHARAECGNEFRIYGLPWNGLAPPDQRALVEALGRSSGNECPEVTLGEAASMIGASERLGRTKDLARAVEALTLWSARAVSSHELRHDADGVRVECPGCPAGMNAAAQDEVSAYLASFADDHVGYLALAQACGMERVGRVEITPHAQALALVLPELLPGGCRGFAPSDLQERARSLELRLFGERPRAAVPERFPETLDLLEH